MEKRQDAHKAGEEKKKEGDEGQEEKSTKYERSFCANPGKCSACAKKNLKTIDKKYGKHYNNAM